MGEYARVQTNRSIKKRFLWYRLILSNYSILHGIIDNSQKKRALLQLTIASLPYACTPYTLYGHGGGQFDAMRSEKRQCYTKKRETPKNEHISFIVSGGRRRARLV